VSTQLSNTASSLMPRGGLLPRIGLVAAVLAVETLFLSYLIQKTPLDSVTGAARMVRDAQHWLFRFIIVYAVSLSMLAYLRGARTRAADALPPSDTSSRTTWAAVHVLLMVPFAVLSAGLYSGTLNLPFAVVAAAWHACAFAAAFALLVGVAPLTHWMQAVRRSGVLPVYAFIAAATAVLAIQASQQMWASTAKLTFRLVLLTLRPLLPTLQSNVSTMTLSTDRFAVEISEKCSGLEGVGLMLVFCATWLWYFRREYYFPRALTIIPAAAILVFVLNALRIAALIVIGDAGYPGIATVGFHSQAGWIAFNLVALGVAVLAKHTSWLHRSAAAPAAIASEDTPPAATASADNPTAAYLMPLLAILAAGMIAHALSAGFDLLYPLRCVAAVAALWFYRRSYATLDWRVSWRAPAVGALIAGVWLVFAHFLIAPAARPEALYLLPAPLRAVWIGARLLAATVTVPIAEELAYRGYVLRRLVNSDFQSVRFQDIRWPALAVCAVFFGITHGTMWLPAILAGLAYGAITIRTGRIGEAVVAHATTNALLAASVLLFDRWQLW
jgi:exosortase E/protease (VPEID-CTERM system)